MLLQHTRVAEHAHAFSPSMHVLISPCRDFPNGHIKLSAITEVYCKQITLIFHLFLSNLVFHHHASFIWSNLILSNRNFKIIGIIFVRAWLEAPQLFVIQDVICSLKGFFITPQGSLWFCLVHRQSELAPYADVVGHFRHHPVYYALSWSKWAKRGNIHYLFIYVQSLPIPLESL